jgi:hypothetical protein
LRGTTIHLLTVEAEELARQMCLATFAIYAKIQPSELVGQVWSKNRELSQNVNALIAWFNHISSWVSTAIVSQSTVRMRVKAMIKAIEITDQLRYCKQRPLYYTMAKADTRRWWWRQIVEQLSIGNGVRDRDQPQRDRTSQVDLGKASQEVQKGMCPLD